MHPYDTKQNPNIQTITTLWSLFLLCGYKTIVWYVCKI